MPLLEAAIAKCQYIYNEKKRKGRGTAGRSIIIARHFECHVVSRYIYMRLFFKAYV